MTDLTAHAPPGRLALEFNRHARRRRRRGVVLLTGPALVIVGGALLIPAANLLVQSFVHTLGYGQVDYHFTLSNYASAITNPTYVKLAWRSFGLGAVAGVICVLLAYPVAYFVTFRLRRGRNLALYLVVISLFSSYLVRLYSWYIVLGTRGLINEFLMGVGVVHQPLSILLFNRFAVLIAFVNIFLPFSILMLTATMQNIPRDLLDTAQDLGSSPIRTFTRVVLPLTTTGLVGAFAYTFILTSGDYITPALLGGPSASTALANIVTDQFMAVMGAAICFVMIAVFGVVYLLVSQLERFKGF
jgi:spermidine/putrescine transport system permease protein